MRIPIKITSAFWVFSGLLSLMIAQGNFGQALMWLGIIFFSILFHELGHALMAFAFGLRPRIELVAMGGLTYHGGEKLSFWKQFLITLAGPFFGFLILVATSLSIIYYGPSQLLHDIFTLNLLWTVVNLFPVLPLDGGQLVRIILEKLFRVNGLRYALCFSMLLAFLASLAFFLTQNIFAGVIFFFFACENFMSYRRSKLLTESDKNPGLQEGFARAELKIGQGNKAEALQEFEAIRLMAKQGMLYVAASQYAAFLHNDLGDQEEAYQILLSLKSQLDPEALRLLHKLAFEKENFSLVLELSGAVYQVLPDAEVALRNAYAAAALKQVDAAIGWLQSASAQGAENLAEIIQEKVFDPVRLDPAFLSFLQDLPHA